MLGILFAFSSPESTLSKITDPNREQTILQVQRLLKAKNRILESYRKLKDALKEMQDRYGTSKESKNVFHRYSEMKKMVKQVLQLEKQYWVLLDLPAQGYNEAQSTYVARVLIFLDERLQDGAALAAGQSKSGISGLLGSATHFAEKAKEIQDLEKLKAKPTDELRKESQMTQADICRISKKYLGLRQLVVQLKTRYQEGRIYPIIPRYSMLKDGIKEALRARAFVDVCHENLE